MRKHQQKQILEIIETLNQANLEMKRLYSLGAISAVLQLLTDCQEGVVHIGEFIEDLEGEGTKTVTLLEDYHESLYHIGLNLENVDINFTKQLQNQLYKIEKSIKSELKPNRIEVVFFPYKVSMWDSLESIWLASKEDPNCDAYVVPIPYFDRLPDGSLGQMHYEGDQYPHNVPVLDWRSYRLEERLPDAIFIHNPYDDGNFITTVHPDYYSGRLKNFTGQLCYVPYFVVSNDIPEHLALPSGVLNADKVILQSEKVRSTYIQVFKDFEKKNQCIGRFGNAESKFISLGSPKFDQIVNSKREDYYLPESWKTIIANRKVVFYNTSVGALLENDEKYLHKLRSVLDLFKSRNDIVLWWRPHPLMEATCQSMRAHLYEAYKQIVEDYKKSGWGIYDDTPDFNRAMALSDALYGDFSSVGALYSVTDRPILISNCDMPSAIDETEKQEYLHSDIVQFGQQLLSLDQFRNMYSDGYENWLPYKNKGQSRFVIQPDYEYGISGVLNAIYKVNEEKARAKYYKSFPIEKYVPWSYNVPIRIGNQMLFTPIRARKWAFYNLDTEEWTFKQVPKELHPSNEFRGTFGGYLTSGDELIFLPGERGAIAKYNIDTQKITYHKEWFSELSDHIVNIDWGIICSALFYNDSLLLFTPQTNIVIELNPNTMTVVNTFRVGDECNGFRSVVRIPNTSIFYLIPYREPGKTPWTERIVQWDIESGLIEVLNDLPINFINNHTQNGLNGFTYWKDQLYAIPLQSDSILKIDMNTNEVIRMKLIPQIDLFERKSEFYNWAINQAMPFVFPNLKTMKYVVQLLNDYSLIDLDIDNGELSNRRKWYIEGIDEIYKENGKGRSPNLPLEENEFLTLEDFLNQLDSETLSLISKKQVELCWEKPAYGDGTSGRRIYEYVKKSGRI